MISEKKKNSEVQTFKLRTDNDLQNQLIPIYNLEATAGLVELFRGSEEMEVLDTMSIPNLPRCDGAVYVAGDSMYPLLKNGDIVAYRKVEDIQNDIFWGEMYLLSIDVGEEEFVTVKYIQKSEKGIEYIKLVSENKHHQDKDVQLKKIRALALIKATIRLNTMN
jgi:phage repressor protein C with HTH and peptisase S24 domain